MATAAEHEGGDDGSRACTYPSILKTWFPLGGKQIIAAAADPMIFAIIMRLGHPTLVMGALYSYMLPILLVVSAPTIGLNTVGNVFGKNLHNLARIRKLSLCIGFGGTFLMGIVSFTPLGAWLLQSVMDVPDSEFRMATRALQVCTIYPMLSAFCSMYQGVLVRGGKAMSVFYGRLVRMVSALLFLLFGLETGMIPEVVLGAGSVVFSLGLQTLYLRLKIGTVRSHLALKPLDERRASLSELVRFTIPISTAPIVGAVTLLLMAAAMGRLPGVIASLAVWPIVSNFNQVGIGLGKSFDQVTMVHGKNNASIRRLFRTGLLIGLGTTFLVAMLNASGFLFYILRTMEALDVETATITDRAMWILTPMPFFYTMCAYYRGLLANALRTTPILISKLIGFVVVGAVLVGSLELDPVKGVYVVASSTVVAAALTLAWLWYSGRDLVQPAA